jgi:hypothetical protein
MPCSWNWERKRRLVSADPFSEPSVSELGSILRVATARYRAEENGHFDLKSGFR